MYKKLLGVIGLSLPFSVLAGDDIELSFAGAPTAQLQSDFQLATEDLTAAFSYKALNPAEPMGLVGFRADAIASYTKMENPDSWRRLTGSKIDELALVGIAAGKGFLFGLDVGAFIAEVPTSNVRIMGGELRYALAEGGIIGPALGVRAAITRMEGADDVSFESRSIDVSISKGLTLITPYAGIGRVWGEASDERGGVTSLQDAEAEETKMFVGARISLGFIKFVFEADQTGENTSYNLRAGIGL